MRVYIIIDEQGYVVERNYFETKPDNSVEIDLPNGLIIPRWNGEEWQESASLEIVENAKKEATKARYEQYKLDGWQAYQDFRADLVEQINKGALTEALAFVIESYLSVAYDKIAHNGDWKTAYYRLSTTVIPSEHSFVEAYKTKALQILGKYINENYPS